MPYTNVKETKKNIVKYVNSLIKKIFIWINEFNFKVIEDLQHEIGEIKDRLLDQKKKIEFQEREISDSTKRAAQLNKDYNEQRKRLQLIESDIEKLRMDRHNYFRTAKVILQIIHLKLFL